ncbi:MAG: YbaB/EbfC family nucleoid-associated protein [Gammaproteobacteria bacterium]|nr:YbaB/EbfC family nucleoid-associated protein [Gammaproteobacteria bacterium]
MGIDDLGFPAIKEEEFNKLRKELEKKVHFSTSDDGVITVEYNGIGEYKRFMINVPLESVDKEALEKDIINIIQYSKNQVQLDFQEIFLHLTDVLGKKEDQEEAGVEERHDVS